MTAYVYGTNPESDAFLCLLPLEYAEQAAKEYAAVFGCQTIGQATAVAAKLTVVDAPGVSGEDPEELEELADEPYEPWEYEDWPPAPAMVSLDLVDEDLRGELIEQGVSSEEETFPQGARLLIPASAEAELVRVVQEQGHEISRNDSLI